MLQRQARIIDTGFVSPDVIGVIGPMSFDAALALAPLDELTGIAQRNSILRLPNHVSRDWQCRRSYSRYAYNATSSLIRTVRQVNSIDVRQVVQLPRQTRHAGLGGDIAFDQAGNRLDPAHTLYRAEGAKWLPLCSFPADSVAATRCGKP
jgi:hypothetical protein